MTASVRSQTIQQLAQQVRQLERRAGPAGRPGEVVSTGIAGLDELLPERGLLPGTLLEWLSEGGGSGAGTLALTVAGSLLQSGRVRGACVVVDPKRSFYPPALVRVRKLRREGQGGVPLLLEQVICVHPASEQEVLWVVEQSLRCSGVGVVVCRLGRLPGAAGRRLQLAAETGGGVGLLLRSGEWGRQPSWADVRLRVQAVPGVPLRVAGCEESSRRLQVELMHCRGRAGSGAVELEIDDVTGDVRMASRMAPAAGSRDSTGVPGPSAGSARAHGPQGGVSGGVLSNGERLRNGGRHAAG